MSDTHPSGSVQIEAGWKSVLKEEFSKPYFSELKAFLVQEKQAGQTIYPPGKFIFNAFNTTPFEKVKAVIIGQDPYHGPGQAHGLSFSVQHGIKPPPSLKNIYKELAEDIGFEVPDHGNLTKWAEQGVLMLNAILTVRQKSPKSHHKKGWEQFTDAVVRVLDGQKTNLVFLLWGKDAKMKGSMVNRDRHCVLESPHPSPYSAHYGFFGNRHFSQTNAYLRKNGLPEIDWQL